MQLLLCIGLSTFQFGDQKNKCSPLQYRIIAFCAYLLCRAVYVNELPLHEEIMGIEGNAQPT